MYLRAGVGVSVCAVKKEFHCLKKKKVGGSCKTQAILCTDGVKLQEISPMVPDPASFHTGEALTFPATPLPALPASKAPQQAGTS